jgi:hypothetical protein
VKDKYFPVVIVAPRNGVTQFIREALMKTFLGRTFPFARCVAFRVTRLGENGRLFALGTFLITERAHNFGLIFFLSLCRLRINFDKNGPGYISGVFSQTHLVTLIALHLKRLVKR